MNIDPFENDNPQMPRSVRSRVLRTLGYGIFLLALLITTAEVVLRFMGFSPWTPEHLSTSIEPGGSLFQPHSRYGYLPRPGTYDVGVTDEYTFTTTHDSSGFRETEGGVPGAPEIWVFGCSFTYGWGVDNEYTWVQQVQDMTGRYRLRNFGIPGGNTLQSLLLLEDLLDSLPPPAAVWLGYAGFHAQRNVNSRYWKKALSGQQVMDSLQYPAVRLNEQQQLVPADGSLQYDPWFLQSWSAIVHWREIRSCDAEEQALHSQAVTDTLVMRMYHRCREKGIPFHIAGLMADTETREALTRWEAAGCTVLMDLYDSDDGNQLTNRDMHPDHMAHFKIGQTLTAWLPADSSRTAAGLR